MLNPTTSRNRTTKSEALELQICRIHELLERSHDIVTWNDRIPDPDNPSQLRQIDISIRRDGDLTIVECRLSRSRQNVKWIEELIGRRQSLGAQTIIAVASAGFTIGAQRKAARYGVLLRDLRQLSDDEIAGWGKQVALILYYYHYSDLNFSVGVSPQNISNLLIPNLRQALESHDILQSAFNAAARQLDMLNLLARNDAGTIDFGIQMRPENILLGSESVLEVRLTGKARLVAQPVTSPHIFTYGQPVAPTDQRGVTVERFTLGDTNIIHHDDQIAIDIDLSTVELPPFSQIRYFCTSSAEKLEHESFAITGPGRIRVAGRLTVGVYALQV